MTTSSLDELNKLTGGGVAKTSQKKSKKKGIPFEDYFGVMEIPEKDKQNRILLATDLEDAVLFIFGLIGADEVSKSLATNQLYSELLSVVGKYGEIDDYIEETVREYTNLIIKENYQNPNDDYYVSKERATFVSEDMSNSYMNYIDYVSATKTNKQKTWHTQMDLKVRPTHKALNEVTVEMDETFKVGGQLMRFPKDLEYGATAEEVINCRCYVTFS